MPDEVFRQDRKAHPDEKGTEREIWEAEWRGQIIIARPIPMKRELKDHANTAERQPRAADRKAHPDEKGTESVSA